MKNLVLLFFISLFFSLDVEAQMECPPATLDSIPLIKYEKIAHRDLRIMIEQFRILVDPEANSTRKYDAKQEILERFQNNGGDIIAPIFFTFELRKNPNRLAPTAKSLSAYLDYLTERYSENELVNTQWCIPDAAEFKFSQVQRSSSILRSINCYAYRYECAFPVGEFFAIRSNEIPFEEYQCKVYNYALRQELVIDTNISPPLEEYIWRPYLKSSTKLTQQEIDKGIECPAQETCVGCLCDPPYPCYGPCETLEPDSAISTSEFYFDFGPEPNATDFQNNENCIFFGREKNTYKINYDHYFGKDNYSFGIVDTSRVLPGKNVCADFPQWCGKEGDDYIIFKNNGAFRLAGVSEEEYHISLWIGSLETNVPRTTFSVSVGDKYLHNVELEPGELRRFDFITGTQNNELYIEFTTKNRTGSDNLIRVSKLAIRRNNHYFDFGDGAVAEDYKPVRQGTKYTKAAGYGLTKGEIIHDVTLNNSDKINGDYSLFEPDSRFVVDLPTGAYSVVINYQNQFQAKIQGNTYKPDKDNPLPPNEPIRQSVKVGREQRMELTLTDSLTGIKSIQIFNSEDCSPLTVWNNYILPGRAWDIIRKKRGSTTSIWPVTTGIVVGSGLGGYYYRKQANAYYADHQTATTLRSINQTYEQYQDAKFKSDVLWGVSAGVWVGTGILAYLKDIRNQKKCAQRNVNNESTQSLSASFKSFLQDSQIDPYFRIDPLTGEQAFGITYHINF